MAEKIKVAFVCVHNSCRSQMAEAIAKLMASDSIEAYSAGTETKPQINQDAVAVIKELYGVDMNMTQKSKLVSDIPPVDVVITMGCNVACPFLPCKHMEDWGLEDPTGKHKEEFIKTAKQIEHNVLDLKSRINSLWKRICMKNNKEEIRTFIRKNYAEVAQRGAEGDLSNVPIEANMGLGCGNPIAIAALQEGEVVLDLGSGGGFDCFLARRQVGEAGYVIGVDMTPDMISLARKNAEKSGYTNLEFRLGEIEHLPVADSSVDAIISNCVINLSLDKEQVFKEAYRVLKPGGRLSTSDVVATAQLPPNIKQDLALIASCIGGAEYVEDIKAMLQAAGFKDVRMTPKDNSREIVKSWAPGKKVEDFVASYLIEAVKEDAKVKISKSLQ